jgi:hypothetical protein
MFGLLTSVHSADAGLFTEVGDAGQSLASAFVLPSGIDMIKGSLNYDADMFRFYWPGGSFYANTVDYSAPFSAQQDCELFLFDSVGYGIVANNDAWDGLNIPAGSAYIYKPGLAAGNYYLGVTIHNLEPVDDSLYYTIFPTFPYVSEPKSPDPTSGPLAAWGNDDLYSWATGNYVVNFAEADLITGAEGDEHPTGTVPEPNTLALLSVAALPIGLHPKSPPKLSFGTFGLRFLPSLDPPKPIPFCPSGSCPA